MQLIIPGPGKRQEICYRCSLQVFFDHICNRAYNTGKDLHSLESYSRGCKSLEGFPRHITG